MGWSPCWTAKRAIAWPTKPFAPYNRKLDAMCRSPNWLGQTRFSFAYIRLTAPAVPELASEISLCRSLGVPDYFGRGSCTVRASVQAGAAARGGSDKTFRVFETLKVCYLSNRLSSRKTAGAVTRPAQR
jgi:hypothetical protein